MHEPIISKLEIAERARQAAKRYAETGAWPQQEFPALSEAARYFDICLQRCVAGGEIEEGTEASA